MNKIIAGSYARITPYGERRQESFRSDRKTRRLPVGQEDKKPPVGQEDKRASGKTGRQEDFR
jgi:hypothetical protein